MLIAINFHASGETMPSPDEQMPRKAEHFDYNKGWLATLSSGSGAPDDTQMSLSGKTWTKLLSSPSFGRTERDRHADVSRSKLSETNSFQNTISYSTELSNISLP